MKQVMFFLLLLFYLFSFQTTSFAAGSTSTSGRDPSVYDSIHTSAGTKSPPPSSKVVDSKSSSIFPLFIKFIASSALVIGLLILLLRFFSKRNRLLTSNGPTIPLGGHVLGNNRSLQVVLIGQTIYIIGVGDNVTLIRSISQGEEYKHLLEGYENQAEGFAPKWLTKKRWNSVFQQHVQNMQHENREE